MTVEVNMPENVVDVYILQNRELVFEVSSEIGETEMCYITCEAAYGLLSPIDRTRCKMGCWFEAKKLGIGIGLGIGIVLAFLVGIYLPGFWILNVLAFIVPVLLGMFL